MTKILLLLIFFLEVSLQGYSQIDKIFIKGDFYNKPLVTFIEELEQKHNIQFQYVNEVVSGIQLNGIIKNNTPLLQTLEILLIDKPISFSATSTGEIILFANEKKKLTAAAKYFKLSGLIKDKVTGAPLPYVTIYIPGASKGAISDDQGMFEIKPITEGTHLIQFSYVGYSSVASKVLVDQDEFISIQMEENALQLSELIITPSVFEISTIESPLVLGKEEILHSPNVGKDIYRTLRTLPGVANTDYSAKARIRGGHSDETAVYLDNLLINEPFHLEEVDGSFSIFNTDYVDELTLLTGGFSAKYADRLSGVVDVSTSDQLPSDQYRFSLDLLNMSFLAQKKISDKVNVFVTARRGYLDFLLRKTGDADTDELDPRFSDVWGKVVYQANRKNCFSFNFLAGRDNFKVKDMDNLVAHLDLSNIRSNYNGWVNWQWFPKKNFSSITTLAYQSLQKDADFIFPDNIAADNIDQNKTNTISFTNSSYLNIKDNHALEFGWEFRTFDSRYRYNEIRYDVYRSTPDNVITQDIDIDKTLAGYTGAAYLQYNWTFKKGFIVQPGVRASFQSFSENVKWAPRVALSYDISKSFTIKAAYGIYYQPDLYFKLRTSLLQVEPYDVNSKSTHYTGSLTFTKGKTHAMINVYHKDNAVLYDDFRYEFFNRIGGVNILDIPFNTVSGYSQGIELVLRQQYGKASIISVSYAYSRSRIRDASDNETFRDFDQPHAIIVNNIFRLPKSWNISMLWTYHTGYPYTPTQVDFIVQRPNEEGIMLFYDAGKKNSARLPDFHSLDLRLEKTWNFKKNSLMAYVNIVNFYKRENIRSYYWWANYYQNGSIGFERETQTNIPFFVSPGISFTLH